MVRRIRHNKKGGARAGVRATRAGTPGGSRMDRLQFYLEPSLHRELERLAAECNVSKAELIRDGVQRVVNEYREGEEDAILKIVGQGRSGITDGSVNHDKYLYGS